MESDRIVNRACYRHLLPLLLDNLEEWRRVAVEGTPGVGKTVFGIVLLRHLVRNGNTVLYWDKNQATMFSSNEAHIEMYGLDGVAKGKVNGHSIHFAAWDPTSKKLRDALLDPEVYDIHDPAEKYVDAGVFGSAVRMIIILSFGHALVSRWATKGAMPKMLTMPCFAYEEILANHENLFSRNTSKTKRTEWNHAILKSLYDRFGGSIRHWGVESEERAWLELDGKVAELARTDGMGLISRTPNSRGSVVHVNVAFDNSKPLSPHRDCNKFTKPNYELGSLFITNKFLEAFMRLGMQSFCAFMQAVKSEKGVEALYGILFEVYAHKILRQGDRPLRVRVVRYDRKEKAGFAVTTIPVQAGQMLSFPGREASGLAKAIADRSAVDQSPIDGVYFMPQSSSFPTYDAAVVVEGQAIGLDDKKVALLLQMTVSGASSLRRRRDHVVRQYMRKEMGVALASDLAVTTFCVPDVCFYPFLFQLENQKDEDEAIQSQPEYQFVVEIPDFSVLPRQDDQFAFAVDEIHATRRTHRYKLRSEQTLKKMKVEELHVVDEGG